MQVITWIAVISTTLLILLAALVVYGWSQSQSIETLRNESSGVLYELDCQPSNFHQQGTIDLDNGEAGWYRACGQLDGRFAAWGNGNLVFGGSYRNGKKHGEFVHYDSNGAVIRRENYINGLKAH